MNQLKLKHGLDEVPPFGELILIGLQWFAIAVPIVIIVGKIVAGLHFDDAAAQIIYIQKIFFLSGIALLAQLFWGHRLPLITGPATILLVAIISGGAGSFGSVYTAISIGGLILFLLNAAGLFGYLSKLFTAPVVATILMLVAFTLAPMIIDLIVSSNAPGQALADLCFSLVLVLALFFVSSRLSGFWKSTLILWALLAGTILYILIFPHNIMEAGTAARGAFGGFFQNMNFKPVFEPGVIIAFLVCFLALSINDLGSIYSVGGMLKTEQMASRIRWGLSFTG
ncbi:MAG: purine/pyrimidine permease, partial [Firmicutes bacterium]|nr:purine/pyrimidine permease [Bacillota bacterium]